MAARLARKFVTVGGIVQAVERSIDEGIAAARAARPLAEGSPMAVELGTRYPILQGPMTRVSDVAPFAEAVARDGGLPFVALAMLRGAEVRRAPASRRPTGWRAGPGASGILGFVPPELRAEQLAAVAEVRPPWALIAGGRPDQAAGAGATGHPHVPARPLAGTAGAIPARREPRGSCSRGASAAVTSGRGRASCSGSRPPPSSPTPSTAASRPARSAWSSPAASTTRGPRRWSPRWPARWRCAGSRSASWPAPRTSSPARRSSTGAIVGRFQDEAIRCGATVLLESGPGHQVRVSPTPFVATFDEERRRLIAEGRPADEVREALEGLNVGRLRVAAKGIERDGRSGLAAGDRGRRLPASPRAVHARPGRHTPRRDDHHRTSSTARSPRRARTTSTARSPASMPDGRDPSDPGPSDIAIIGMSAVFPGAGDLARFWSNTLRGVDAITEVPPDRWDWRLYYDPDPKAPDKIVSKWGGFLPDIAFDPLRFGMPPSSLPSIEPAQLLALEVVRKALGDAGYAERPFARERTAVVLGMGGGAAQLAMGYAFRSYLPMLDTVIPGGGRAAIEACRGQLPEWTEDSFPGFLLNVTAGRIANRLNLGGANYTVDAACGSSLAAAALAVRELETGAADMVILGGVDTVQNPFTYLAFSKTQAFSPRGRCRPFDAGANGIVISEGVAAVVLKRLADAERDGDRIYAVIKGLGASSDGRAGARPRRWSRARSGPSSGPMPRPASRPRRSATSRRTAPGRRWATSSRSSRSARSSDAAGAGARDCVVGSVKSLIGHTKCAAGLAGLINASMALHHKVLPPTIGIETAQPQARPPRGPVPPLHRRPSPGSMPRTAVRGARAVSAFGFGGTNFHAVLEEYDRNIGPTPASALPDWPAEFMLFEADDPAGLIGVDRSADPGARGRRAAGSTRPVAYTDRGEGRGARGEGRVERDPGDRRQLARRPAREAATGAGSDRGGAGGARGSAGRLLRREAGVAGCAGGVPLPGTGCADAGNAARAGGRLPRGPRGVRGIRPRREGWRRDRPGAARVPSAGFR